MLWYHVGYLHNHAPCGETLPGIATAVLFLDLRYTVKGLKGKASIKREPRSPLSSPYPPQASTDIAAARRIMNLKGIRFLPVVIGLPPSPAAVAALPPPPPPSDATTSIGRFARRRANSRRGDIGWRTEEGGGESTRNSGPNGTPLVMPTAPLPQAVVGVLTPESVRIAGRLTETERAIRDRPVYPPPPPPPLPLSPLSSPPPPPPSTDEGES